MADTFAGLLDDADGLVAGVLNTHPSTRALLAAAVVRQLAALQPEVVPFMELAGSFPTIAGQKSYTAADASFPKGLLRFERLWYDLGSYARFLEVVDPETVRYLQEQPSQAYPTRVCWYEEKLQFGPAPAAIYTVKWDLILDATKDTATGAKITAASTSETNGWFSTGKVALKHLVWADYFMTSPDQRPETAASHGNLASLHLDRLRKAGMKRQEMNAPVVTPNAFDSYRGSSSARIQALFPGAPI